MRISVVGIGLGDPRLFTQEARDILSASKTIIGAQRQIKSVEGLGSDLLVYASLQELKELVSKHDTIRSPISILASGDPMYYGITDWLKRQCPDVTFDFFNGISSAQYLFAKIGLQMHDVYLTSAHGRDPKWQILTTCSKVCMVTDQKWNPYAIAAWHVAHGYNPWIIVGESLSYPQEQITQCRAIEIEERAYAMNIVVIDYER